MSTSTIVLGPALRFMHHATRTTLRCPSQALLYQHRARGHEPTPRRCLATTPQQQDQPPTAASTAQPEKKLVGRVISAGLMEKTVKMRVAGQIWNKKLQKYYKTHTDHLVRDPASSLRTGDVVVAALIGRRRPVQGLVAQKAVVAPKLSRVRHVVREILVPFGEGIDQRPPIPPQ